MLEGLNCRLQSLIAGLEQALRSREPLQPLLGDIQSSRTIRLYLPFVHRGFTGRYGQSDERRTGAAR
jgi:hypothetical protein